MKSNIALCALVLGGSMFVVAQQPTTSPSSSTPPTFPTDQQSQAPGAAQPASPDTNPTASQSSSTASQTGAMDSSASAKSTEGCLSQATSGNGFILTDQSGVQYTLQGQTADLSSHVGQEVRVKGDVAPSTSAAANTDNPDSKSSTSAASSTGASSSTTSSSSNASSINVTSVKKISDTCSMSQNPSSK